eukprot:CAMPEP_0172557476 /NCGR_PEP_ID=MMETSP1067-20121228/73425_1 /TAXON_ID=265564 ORGANISM="Thalassiosira punctigera, Strain Tpunct2005C2" /NCGR_SAMPLE_ID=MMETSP1067 /ASSEMBLY_ACC=CAM_ASM_000444 /LENGTH=458 /DNA_ID=CAMNT_0013346565 /DNA_START=82 /DNA_END=1458 /DNA_ORIENTATION=+
MTLEELASLDGSDDEEIDEDGAFNSDDEKVYGKYFSSSARNKIRSKNLSLPIPLQHNTVRTVEIAGGSKMTLSSLCLDISTCDFDQVKLVYRCMYPGQGVNQTDDFCCLCNYLSAKMGGSGLAPSTPLNLEVIGPCKVEFRAEISPTSWIGGGINIFGIVMPFDHFIGADTPFRYAEAFMSEDEGIELENRSILENGSASNGKKDNADGTNNRDVLSATVGKKDNADDMINIEASPTKKRKLEEDNVDEKTSEQGATSKPTTPVNPENSDKKLTKHQRKRLAREKAKQLEETLSAARNDANNDGANDAEAPAKKKSKKKKNKQQPPVGADTTEREPLAKPTSVTRERRMAGGLVVSDMLLGTGAPVRPGKRISLHYTGSLRSTGKVFDKNNSKQHPLVFRQGTGEVIRGLERGLDGMKVGGERVITIPSKLGYGTKRQGNDIPPDSDLVFEVKVLKVG